MHDITKEYKEAKKKYFELLNKFKEQERKRFLSCLMEHDAIKTNETLYTQIKEFNPVEAYIQLDKLFLENAYLWAKSIVFVNEEEKEKALIVEKSNDFDPKSIAISNYDYEKFFKDENGWDIDEEFPELAHFCDYPQEIMDVHERYK